MEGIFNAIKNNRRPVEESTKYLSARHKQIATLNPHLYHFSFTSKVVDQNNQQVIILIDCILYHLLKYVPASQKVLKSALGLQEKEVKRRFYVTILAAPYVQFR